MEFGFECFPLTRHQRNTKSCGKKRKNPNTFQCESCTVAREDDILLHLLHC